MAKLNLKKQNSNDVVNRLIGLIQSTDDIIEIFYEANKGITRLVKCHQITILLNNEKARYFYINHALNYNNRDNDNQDIIIHYGETSLTEVLRARDSIIRDDLTGKGKLTPGDLKFLSKEIKSDMAIPIMNRNGIAGIINLGSRQISFFTKLDQKFAEQVAALLGFALERSQTNEKLNQQKAELQSWEKKFTCLMRNSSEAVAIVRSDYDLIYETNPAFQKFTGYTAEQLQGMRLSFLHPTYQELIASKLQAQSSNGKAVDVIELPLLKKDGKQVIVRLQFAAQKELNRDLVFAIYRHIEPVPTQSNELTISPGFMRELLEFSKREPLDKIFEFFLQEIYSKLGFKYAALKISHPESKETEVVIIRKFPGNSVCDDAKSWRTLLNQDIFTQASDQKNSHIIRNSSADPDSAPWHSLANKLDFQTFIAMPINFDTGKNGVVSFFYENEKTFNDNELDYLPGVCALLSLVTSSMYFNLHHGDQLRQLSAIRAILELANAGTDQAELVKNSLVNISKIIPFDFAELTLFDVTGEHAQNFTMASETSRNLNPTIEWQKIDGAELYWRDADLKNLRRKFHHGENKSQDIEKLLRSSAPVAIMQQDNYLGTLVIGSLKANVYSHEQKLFIEQAAQQIGLVIQNYKFNKEKIELVKEFFDQVASICSIGASLEIDSVLSAIVDKCAAAMNAQIATIRLVADNHPASDLTMTESTIDQNAISDFEMNYILPRMLIKNAPFLHESGHHSEFNKHKNESLDAIRTFFSIPIKSNNKTIAILTIFWTSQHEIQVNELNFISAIAEQSARTIENAMLHQNLRDSLFQAKTKYAELENMIYHVCDLLTNSMSSIQGILATLQNEFLATSREIGIDQLASIETKIERMQYYVRDVQDFCQIQRSAISFEEVNIGEVISRASSELVEKLNDKKIKLAIDNGLPCITCNSDWMVQVFHSLIEHAMNCFTEQTKNPIIEVGHRTVNGGHQFYVRDNGSGINKDDQRQLLEPFYHESSEKSYADVRLPLVKRIIESHNGELWVESEPGKGSTFYFTLPQKQ